MKITHKNITLYYNRSLAFLEQAKISVQTKESKLYNTEEYSNVTTYLVYHSIELFIKFAILARTEMKELATANKYFTQNLSVSLKEYNTLYTDPIFNISLPFTNKVFNGLNNLDQMLKYPCDNKNELWNNSSLFSFTEDFILDLQSNINNIASKILLELNKKYSI